MHPELAPIVSLCPAANEVLSHQPVHIRVAVAGVTPTASAVLQGSAVLGTRGLRGSGMGESDLLGDIGERPCRHRTSTRLADSTASTTESGAQTDLSHYHSYTNHCIY